MTGHRWNRLAAADEPELKVVLARTFSEIEERADTGVAGFVLVTGLAEGVDQVGAEAMPGHWQLEIILPMPKDAFIIHLKENGTGDAKDREHAVSRFLRFLARPGTVIVELPSSTRAEDMNTSAFTALRDALLMRSDMLVAVWDGDESAVKPGGTTDVVQTARTRGVPVIVVPTASRGNGS